MNKFSLLLPIVLFACGSEAADGTGIPGADQTAAIPGPGATDAVGTGTPVSAPVSTDQGSSHDHDIALSDGTNAFPAGRGFPSIDPAPSSPAADPTPSTDPSAPTTDPSTATTDPSTTPTDPSPTDPSTTPTDPSTTDAGTPSTDPCAPTSSGNQPNGRSKGTGSENDSGSSIWACGGPL